MTNFDRYSSFNANGKLKIVPFIKITKKGSDRYIIYNKKTMRLDKISNDFYNNPDFGWLIMQSNPEYGSIENFLPDGILLRIPFPLEETLNTYLNDITKYKELYE